MITEVIYFPKKCNTCKSTVKRVQKMWQSFWQCENDLCPTNHLEDYENVTGVDYNGCGTGSCWK